MLSFAPGTERVTVRLATSYLGLTQGRRTLGQELTGRSFEEIRTAAHGAWMQRLQVIEVPDASPAQRRTLYGNLYRLNLYPSSHWENAGTLARPEPVHASPVLPTKGEATDSRGAAQVLPGMLFVNHGFWDTYRTAWPAYALLYPQLAAQLADGFVQQYREGGWIARWSSPGYADCMTGTSSDIAIADLQVKGVPLPDARSAYESGLRNATVAPSFPEVGRKGNERAVFTGYVDTDTEESVSWALEGHLNDFGLAAQAGLLAVRAMEEGDEQAAVQLQEESNYLARPQPELPAAVRFRDRVLPGTPQGRQLRAEPRGVRPAGMGRGVHGDRRLELRLPRPARRGRAGDAVRRSRDAPRTPRAVLRHPASGRSCRAATGE